MKGQQILTLQSTCATYNEYQDSFHGEIIVPLRHSLPTLSCALGALLTLSQPLQALPSQLKHLLPYLADTDPRVIAAKEEVAASNQGIRQARSDWLPSLEASAFVGDQQRYMPSPSNNSFYGTNQQKLTLNQLIYDFGKTGSAIDSAKLSYQKSISSYNGTLQDVTLEGITAYLNIYRAYHTLLYSKRYQKNVAQQVEMEKSRVNRGSGYSTDVLEAQAQLSGAEARLIRAQGGLVTAKNAFLRTFRETAKSIASFKLPKQPSVLPKSLKTAINTALANNTQIQVLEKDIAIAKQSIRASRANFAPSFKAVFEGKRDYNVDGTVGRKLDYTEKLEMSYSLFSGMGDIAGLRAAQNNLIASQRRLDNQRLITEQKVRNDWQNLKTQKDNYLKLNKQVKQLAEFLRLAKKERKLGRKTLLEVLVADSNYINAADASVAAHVDLYLARYDLLRDMNALSLKNVGA